MIQTQRHNSSALIAAAFAFTTFFTACSGETNKPEDPAIADTQIAKETTIHCYMKVVGADTFHLRLNKTGVKVTGDLDLHFAEKDRSIGQVTGEMAGDTLYADYTFQAEGKESTRELVFVLREVHLQEGYGEQEDKKGKMVFKDKSGLQFSDTAYYRNIPCPSQDQY